MKYEQIFIKSEKDLPKHNSDQILLCQLKSGTIDYFANSTIRCDWERVDWYLQPLDSTEEPEKEQILTDFASKLIDNRKDIDPEIAEKLTPEFFKELHRKSNPLPESRSEQIETAEEMIREKFNLGKKPYPKYQWNDDFVISVREIIELMESFAPHNKKVTDEEIEKQFPTDLKVICEMRGIPINFNAAQGEYIDSVKWDNQRKQEGAKWMRDITSKDYGREVSIK